MNSEPLEAYERHNEKLNKYFELLVKWNKKINLTSIDEPADIVELHFIDSLSLLPLLVSRETVLDIGSGAGFPGIPLKIARPELKVTLVDSVRKKCDFMKTVCRELRLDGISVIHQRLTEKDSIGKFDTVVSRATLKMDELIRLALPNLAENGLIVALKGFEVSREIEACQDALNEFKLDKIREIVYTLPASKIKRKLLITGKEFHVEHFS